MHSFRLAPVAPDYVSRELGYHFPKPPSAVNADKGQIADATKIPPPPRVLSTRQYSGKPSAEKSKGPVVRYDGLYQSDKNDDGWYYLRFYDDQEKTVLAVFSDQPAAESAAVRQAAPPI